VTGAELYEHLRDDGAGASLAAALILIGSVVAISTAVHLWHTRRRRRVDPETARIIAALRREGYRMYGPDDEEWEEFARKHGMHRIRLDRVDRLVDDALNGDGGDGLTRDWRWP